MDNGQQLIDFSNYVKILNENPFSKSEEVEDQRSWLTKRNRLKGGCRLSMAPEKLHIPDSLT
jgi:hypothetical protein